MDWLTVKQADAVDRAVSWYKNRHTTDEFKLFGYAGTGKTTIARSIADALGVDVYFCAPTGKAAAVLNRKGCEATTIHRLIYRVSATGVSDLVRQLIEKFNTETDPDLRRELNAQINRLRQPTFHPEPVVCSR